MCGQLYVKSVRTESLPEIWESLSGNGFTVALADPSDSYCGEAMRISRGDREMILGVDRDSTRCALEAFIVTGHPPSSAWPWRWVGDQRYFNDVTAVLDDFHYLD